MMHGTGFRPVARRSRGRQQQSHGNENGMRPSSLATAALKSNGSGIRIWLSGDTRAMNGRRRSYAGPTTGGHPTELQRGSTA